jgi:hypothetical protein
MSLPPASVTTPLSVASVNCADTGMTTSDHTNAREPYAGKRPPEHELRLISLRCIWGRVSLQRAQGGECLAAGREHRTESIRKPSSSERGNYLWIIGWRREVCVGAQIPDSVLAEERSDGKENGPAEISVLVRHSGSSAMSETNFLILN